MKYAIVSNEYGKIPEHVKGAQLVTYDSSTGVREEHKIKTYLPFFYGLNTILTANKLGAKYLITSRELRAKRSLQKRDIKNLVREQGTSIDQITGEIEAAFAHKKAVNV